MKRVAARSRGEPGHPPLLLHRQAGDAGRRPARWSPPIWTAGWRRRSRAAAASRPPGCVALVRRLSGLAVRGPRVLDRVRRVLGRDAARSAPARDQRRRSTRAPGGCIGAVRGARACAPGAFRRVDLAARRRGGARARRRPLAAAHVRPRAAFPWPRRRASAATPSIAISAGRPRHDTGRPGQAPARGSTSAERHAAPAAQIHERVAAAFAALDAALSRRVGRQAARAADSRESGRPRRSSIICWRHTGPAWTSSAVCWPVSRPPGEPIPAALQSKAPLLSGRGRGCSTSCVACTALILELLEAVPPDPPPRPAPRS